MLSVVPPMKIGDYEVREGLHYAKEHDWVLIDKEKCRVGITDYAQRQLHEVVYVDLPPVGKSLIQNSVFGTIESVKSVSDLYAPLSGEVIQRNENLMNSPEIVNQDPYGAGWIVVVKPSRLDDELKNLLGPGDYAQLLEQLVKKQ